MILTAIGTSEKFIDGKFRRCLIEVYTDIDGKEHTATHWLDSDTSHMTDYSETDVFGQKFMDWHIQNTNLIIHIS